MKPSLLATRIAASVGTTVVATFRTLKPITVCLGLAVLLFATAFAVAQSATQTTENLTLLGTTSIASSSARASQAASTMAASDRSKLSTEARNRISSILSAKHTDRGALPSIASSSQQTLPPTEPIVASSTVVNSQGNRFRGFEGLSNIDEFTVSAGNTITEPPNTGLCAGNGQVLETVQDVIQVFDSRGNPLTAPGDVQSFFTLLPQSTVIPFPFPPGTSVPILNDPRCYFDNATKRWFVSAEELILSLDTFDFTRVFNLLAVSKTSNPTGDFAVFEYDITDDGTNGTPSHPGCLCTSTWVYLGADQNGIYQSIDQQGRSFNGAQIFAISKPGLVAAAAGGALPLVVQLDVGPLLVPFGGLAYSVFPSASPSRDSDADKHSGIEYFLSGLQFGNQPGFGRFDNRLAVWAITNTKSLNTTSPALSVDLDVIQSETYGQPAPFSQRSGHIPLGDSLGEPLEMLNPATDGMQQVTLADGLLYSALNSQLTVAGASQIGAAWFVVKPFFNGSKLKGKVFNQGYIAVAGNNVVYPAFAVNKDGSGAIGYNLAGPDYFPSVAYSLLDGRDVSRKVHIAGAGQDAEDGFSGYPAFFGGSGPGVAQWGFHSAAASDGERVWFAGEYIPNSCSANTLPCRTELMNWGTFVASVVP